MRTKIISTIAGLLLAAIATVALPAAPAGAHHFDTASGYVCAAHRPPNTVLFHSWPDAMGPGWVRYWCRAGVIYGPNWQYWVIWDQNAGTTRLASGWQECNPGGVTWCGVAGH